MATGEATAPIIAEARGLVTRIEQINRALDLLHKSPDLAQEACKILATEDAQGLADMSFSAACEALQIRRDGAWHR